ncbi:arylsulfatase A-like enzyme [Marinimicrobium koreense]|uniref:Arylsulfatase A-like enzyme n=1 Tax=Marinimicrobium koreense TaxID=306545 RepID=A0A3N1PAK1_9GAMM|nr:arylsulfatase [Marinimicrobium koreense]ROQ21716.1 arylsulfatase A-like enzyme [Marinimicrobium koreense]
MMSVNKIFLISMSLLVISGCGKNQTSSGPISDVASSSYNESKPNVVLIYADDLGYGDLSSYGATAVKTPHVDKLADEGIRFTDAHSPAATCTPSRFSMLTGQYAFRAEAEIIPGDAPLVIDPEEPTLADMFKRAGYNTAVIGKWHLGLGSGNIDWNDYVSPGPAELGFDYSFLIPATGDRVPTAYLENQRIYNLDPEDPITVSYKEKIGDRPVGRERPDLLKQQADDQHSDSIVNGISRIGYMKGGKSAEYRDEEFAKDFAKKSEDFIEKNKSEPFFLFLPTNNIHVPRVPNEQFVGATDMGPRGDHIVELDWFVGEIVSQLERHNLLDNTLILFSSDNGPVLDDGYEDFAVEMLGNHKPSGPFSGGKYSILEAGTRVPMIAYYPKKIQPGVSDALFSHIDFYASLASLIGVELNGKEAKDSENILPALMDANEDGRTYMLEEAYTLALRRGDWKYIEPFTGTLPDWMKNKAVDAGLKGHPQLFNLSEDPEEKVNLAERHPKILKELQSKLDEIKSTQ